MEAGFFNTEELRPLIRQFRTETEYMTTYVKGYFYTYVHRQELLNIIQGWAELDSISINGEISIRCPGESDLIKVRPRHRECKVKMEGYVKNNYLR